MDDCIIPHVESFQSFWSRTWSFFVVVVVVVVGRINEMSHHRGRRVGIVRPILVIMVLEIPLDTFTKLFFISSSSSSC